jgi:hypothetical protein
MGPGRFAYAASIRFPSLIRVQRGVGESVVGESVVGGSVVGESVVGDSVGNSVGASIGGHAPQVSRAIIAFLGIHRVFIVAVFGS